MKTYEYGRIAKLADELAKAGIDQSVHEQIMAGGESIRRSTTPQKKAAWMKEAMDRMDALLDESTRRSVREGCACCLSGKRLEISTRIGRTHCDLKDAIEAANKARLVFGHSVTHQDDGRVLVSFAPEGQESYRCVCLPKAEGPVSVTYCYCCGGHVKHHLQNALGRKLNCTVRSSALESGGKSPCTFLFEIVE